MGRQSEPPVDYDSLAEFLRALSNPVRLELLDALHVPRMVGELRVSPVRLETGDNAHRPAARQTLQTHLDKLVAADFVREEKVTAGERTLRRYVVNSSRLYVVAEELRRVCTQHAGRGVGDESTQEAGMEEPEAADRASGPRLVLVRGALEGKSFRLDPAFSTKGQWLVGRRRGLAVSLDYDPFVSAENAAVVRQGDEYAIMDVPGSRNGTSLNWRLLSPGVPRVLRPGDVVGVGRSLLVFSR